MSGVNEKFYDVIKQSKAFNELVLDYENNQLSHAYAIISTDVCTARLLIKAFLAHIYSKTDSLAESKVFSYGYLDNIWVPAIAEEKKLKMSVADVDYMMQTAFIMPSELDYKWIIISPDEPISEAVQNKLLKNLEEPPSHTRFIICSASTGDLLPTVLSRVRVINVDEFSYKTVLSVLKQNYPSKTEECEIASTYCNGRIALAEKMVENPIYLTAYHEALEILTNVQRSPQILPYAFKLGTSKDYFVLVAEFMQAILHDALLINSGCNHLIGVTSRIDDIIKIADDFTLECIIKITPCFERVNKRLRLYGNLQSVVDELLFSILEVKAKCKK